MSRGLLASALRFASLIRSLVAPAGTTPKPPSRS